MSQAVLRRRIHLAAVFAVVMLLISAGSAFAHDFWINASVSEKGVITAEIGYGHDFPAAEIIAEERLHIFDALHLAMPDKTVKLDQVGENYAYHGKIDLPKGSYMVLGTYKPTFWSNGSGGWSQTDRIQRPDADYVQEAAMFAKTIINIDGSTDESFISKPTGQRLEIVPLKNPATVKAGEKFPIQILADGKPVRTARVEATFAGFSDREYKAFAGRTDLQGMIDLIPLRAGYWFVKTSHSFDHEDKTRADEVSLSSTLTFYIAE